MKKHIGQMQLPEEQEQQPPRRRVVVESAGHLPIQTSETHPIEISWLPRNVFSAAKLLPKSGGFGALGMTIAPGRNSVGRTARFSRNLEADMSRLAELGTTVLVPLLEESEFFQQGMQSYWRQAYELSLDVRWFPIQDGNTPSDPYQTELFVDQLLECLADPSSQVVIHCKAGLGRTGTLAACTLIALGVPPKLAISVVKNTRKGAIEYGRQEMFVMDFARLFGSDGGGA